MTRFWVPFQNGCSTAVPVTNFNLFPSNISCSKWFFGGRISNVIGDWRYFGRPALTYFSGRGCGWNQYGEPSLLADNKCLQSSFSQSGRNWKLTISTINEASFANFFTLLINVPALAKIFKKFLNIENSPSAVLRLTILECYWLVRWLTTFHRLQGDALNIVGINKIDWILHTSNTGRKKWQIKNCLIMDGKTNIQLYIIRDQNQIIWKYNSFKIFLHISSKFYFFWQLQALTEL